MMILLVAFLLLVEGLNYKVSCYSLGVTENENISVHIKREFYRGDDNSILDSIKGRDTKPSSQRSKRDLELTMSSTEAPTNTNVAYERAINQTISEYHIQRKAVMDRYYARQREIVAKFSRRTPKSETAAFRTTFRPTTLLENNTTEPEITSTTEENYETEKRIQKIENNGLIKSVSNERETDREEKNNSSGAWIYRSSNWNPKVVDIDTDIDLEPESSNTLERSVDKTVEIPGYYKLGNFKGSKDEKVVYQHNLGVGLKGSSQLDATFEAIIEGPYEITIVEAFPYANTRANFTWLGGGPGTNFVKLKLQGYENEGFSYSVKVWGVPKKM